MNNKVHANMTNHNHHCTLHVKCQFKKSSDIIFRPLLNILFMTCKVDIFTTYLFLVIAWIYMTCMHDTLQSCVNTRNSNIKYKVDVFKYNVHI